MTTDLVKIGRHADLGFGMRLPLLGAGAPDRNLTEEERGMAENLIRTAYKDFVGKVAAGRNMKPEDIDKIGQGRVWPGVDGKANGLVDELGGLETALLMAKDAAGIARDADVDLVELPAPDLFDAGIFAPKLIGFASRLGLGSLVGARELLAARAAEGEGDPVLNDLRFRLEHSGQPLVLLPMDDMDMAIDAQTPIGN